MNTWQNSQIQHKTLICSKISSEKIFKQKVTDFWIFDPPTGPKISKPKNDNFLRKICLFGSFCHFFSKNPYKFDAKKYISSKFSIYFFSGYCLFWLWKSYFIFTSKFWPFCNIQKKINQQYPWKGPVLGLNFFFRPPKTQLFGKLWFCWRKLDRNRFSYFFSWITSKKEQFREGII